jgi:hypothetical protein
MWRIFLWICAVWVGLEELTSSPSIAPCFSIVSMAFAVTACTLGCVIYRCVCVLCAHVARRNRPALQSKSEVEFVSANNWISSLFEPPCVSPLPPRVRAFSLPWSPPAFDRPALERLPARSALQLQYRPTMRQWRPCS